MELQEQRLEAARREAELLRMEEEEQRRIAEAVAAERHACCAALLQGAEILAGRASLADCTIDQLNSIQEAGQRLAALCQDGKETLLRNEKAALEQQVAKERALQAKREHEALVLQEKCRVLEHMRHANKCPICRVPIRGVLEQLATSS
ncbi:hypothetical protein WJX72_006448 [[Myrmecia] bisecta]|uniref:RING-type domain-containing protein n=1 Tax=[Myrmecia] bisecta TaxID=41462 RepID=A0AAW1PT66_9CHLO